MESRGTHVWATICINDAITELRTAVRKLTRAPEPSSLNAALIPLSRSVARWLGHDPTISTRGRLDHLAPDLAHDLLMALTRMLAAVALRSEVHDVWIEVAHDADRATILVTDDGNTPPDPSPTGSIHDLQVQAQARSGAFTQQPRRPNGTIMEWSVPTLSPTP